MKFFVYLLIAAFFFSLGSAGCKKFVDVDPPPDVITSELVFSNAVKAESAVASIYGSMINNNSSFSGGITIATGFSSDELKRNNADPSLQEFIDNHIQPGNNEVEQIWENCYRHVYYANSAIYGLEHSKITDSTRIRLLGESYFLRAFFYFYLVNLYGKVPLVLTTDYTVSQSMGSSSETKIYDQIVLDLKTSKELLKNTESIRSKIRVNKWSVSAFLARVYLYRENWEAAIAESSLVIDSKQFALSEDLKNVFSANSSEAVWQLQPHDGYVPELFKYFPLYGLENYSTQYLLNSFEPSDLRYGSWFEITVSDGISYKYPAKYRAITFKNDEYYMVLRFAEQYLIRAEARAQMNDLESAGEDLYTLRKRAGLQQVDMGSKTDLLKNILHERQVELFSEWGHRWFDLKRTGSADSVLKAIKPLWKAAYKLYPIPESQLLSNKNLIQNNGY